MISRLDRPACYYRTLQFLLATLDPIQWRRLSAREIATEAIMSMSSAERAIAMLIADKVTFAQGTTAARALRLNNRIVWKSNSEKWNCVQPDEEIIDARGR